MHVCTGIVHSQCLLPPPPSLLLPLRCSLVYEGIIAAIRDELAAARQRAAAAAASARAAEGRVQESMFYSRDKFAAMEAEVKHLARVRGRRGGSVAGWLGGIALWGKLSRGQHLID